MNRILFFSTAIILLISCRQNTSPVLEINTQAVEHLSDTATHSFLTLYNNGNENIVIEDYKTSCSCTVLKINKGQTIVGKDSLIVPVSFDRDSSSKTKRTITITFKSNTKPILNTVRFSL